jgi:hypothetical protein
MLKCRIEWLALVMAIGARYDGLPPTSKDLARSEPHTTAHDNDLQARRHDAEY